MIFIAIFFVTCFVPVSAFAFMVRESSRFWTLQDELLRKIDDATTLEELDALVPLGKELERIQSGFRGHAAGVQETLTAYRIKRKALQRSISDGSSILSISTSSD